MKVSELAVKLSLDPQILKEKLRVQGFDAKSVVSQVPDDLAKKMIHEKIASSANQNAVVTYRSAPTKVEGEEGADTEASAVKKPKRRFKMMADGSMQLISDETAAPAAPAPEAPAAEESHKPELSISQVADQDAIPKSSIDKYTFPVNYGRAKAGNAGTPSGQRQTPAAGGHGGGHNAGQRPRRKKRKYKRDRSEEEEILAALVKPIDQQTEEERNNEIRIATLDSPTFMVKDLAAKLNVSLSDLMKEFLKMGALFTVNQEIDIETATKVAQRFGIMIELDQKGATVGKAEKKMIEKLEEETAQDKSKQKNRPPVITIMGHVDHGKTKLLDTIRASRVAEGEAGGITQHIGAYQVKVKNRVLTFLDTPGHAAFTQLRARGAQVTDVVVLVVAADDGVMPQTLEAIDHARAAKVPIVVAINKIDKPEANIERSKQMLTEHGLVPEEWGGDTVMVPISAKANKNIDELLDLIITVADLKELKANYDTQAQGVIIEAKLSAQRGSVPETRPRLSL
jgi:translation initiation factor IF-2